MKRILLALLLATVSSPASAHLDPGQHGSFAAGFSHPLFGADHILAMVAVGLWAALLGGAALWRAPSAFVGAMVLGFAAALSGFPLPFVEPVILASVIVIGLLAALALRVPVATSVAVLGVFGFFHGHAHGGELGSAGTLSFAFGFVIATALLHATGLFLGLWLMRLAGEAAGKTATRAAGAMTALAGFWLVVGA